MPPMSITITQRKVDELIPYVRNSRTHSDEQVAQIAASIKEFGWTNPILVDGEGVIIAGHGRLLAARKLGFTEVPTIELRDLTEAQKKAYVIADNRLALNAGWDNEMLTLELGELAAEGYNLDLLGFDTKELDALLEPEVVDGMVDEDEVPEVGPEPITKPGDVWVLGRHRLMCGDSTSVDAVDKLMAGGKADMVFTDPPYTLAGQLLFVHRAMSALRPTAGASLYVRRCRRGRVRRLRAARAFHHQQRQPGRRLR